MTTINNKIILAWLLTPALILLTGCTTISKIPEPVVEPFGKNMHVIRKTTTTDKDQQEHIKKIAWQEAQSYCAQHDTSPLVHSLSLRKASPVEGKLPNLELVFVCE